MKKWLLLIICFLNFSTLLAQDKKCDEIRKDLGHYLYEYYIYADKDVSFFYPMLEAVKNKKAFDLGVAVNDYQQFVEDKDRYNEFLGAVLKTEQLRKIDLCLPEQDRGRFFWTLLTELNDLTIDGFYLEEYSLYKSSGEFDYDLVKEIVGFNIKTIVSLVKLINPKIIISTPKGFPESYSKFYTPFKNLNEAFQSFNSIQSRKTDPDDRFENPTVLFMQNMNDIEKAFKELGSEIPYKMFY